MERKPEYIEREAACQVIKSYGHACIDQGKPTLDVVDDIVEMVKMIEAVPAADVVEVVRCRECKFCRGEFKSPCEGCDEWGCSYDENDCDELKKYNIQYLIKELKLPFCPMCGKRLEVEKC